MLWRADVTAYIASHATMSQLRLCPSHASVQLSRAALRGNGHVVIGSPKVLFQLAPACSCRILEHTCIGDLGSAAW